MSTPTPDDFRKWWRETGSASPGPSPEMLLTANAWAEHWAARCLQAQPEPEKETSMPDSDYRAALELREHHNGERWLHVVAPDGKQAAFNMGLPDPKGPSFFDKVIGQMTCLGPARFVRTLLS